jgi:hypothetical protein
MLYKHLNDKYGTVLKMDIDTNYIPFFAVKGLQFVSRIYTLQHLIIKRSPSKKHYHIIACIKEKLSDSEIIAWQLICGSDKYRERHNLIRHANQNSMEVWNILFSNKKYSKISL